MENENNEENGAKKEKVLSSIIKEDTDELRRNEQENERG